MHARAHSSTHIHTIIWKPEIGISVLNSTTCNDLVFNHKYVLLQKSEKLELL